MTLRIGLMGCGSVASFGHLPAIAASPDFHLVALYDPDSQRLAELQAQYNVALATFDAEAFFRSGLDAIVVTSPAPIHETNVIAAAKHGLPVLCEKPLSMDRLQGERMIAAMEAAGVPLYVAFCYRFSPAALRIKQLIDEGTIGTLRAQRLLYLWDCHGKYNARDPQQGLNAAREGRMFEGGPMVDCGTHQIDLAQWWADSPAVRCIGHGAWADEYDAPDHTWAHLDHASGVHSMIEISYSYGHTARDPLSSFQYELIGTGGIIRYHRNESFFELRNAEGTFRQEYTQEKNFHGLYAAFAKALQSGEPGHLPTAARGLEVTALAVVATEQAVAGRVAC